MAEIFYEPGTGKSPAIPYPAVAELLFPDEPRQKLMPFLGAAASLRKQSPPERAAPIFPLQDTIDEISNQLHLQGKARLFMDLAVRLASEIQAEEEQTTKAPGAQATFTKLLDSHFPPSAGDLAELLASLSSYDSLERPRQRLRALVSASKSDLAQVLRWIALLTDIAEPTAPLLAVSSYYEYTLQRRDLWEKLHRVFANKKWPTPTIFLIARAAHWHLRPQRRARKDYLILTTNYDCLMEVALDLFDVPYCVLTVDRRDRFVDVRFSDNVQQYLGLDDEDFREFQNEHNGRKYPTYFTLEKARPLAVVYKIHGCLFPIRPHGDSIILSDEDYVDYMCRLSDNLGMIPGSVRTLMEGKRFLFAGYSFSDWNVRGIYRRLVESRGPADELPDFAVVRDLNVYEAAFFRQKTINLLQTDLSQFSRQIRIQARRWMARASGGTSS